MGYADQARRFAEHNVADWRAAGARRIIAIDPHDYIAFTEDYPDYFGDDYDFEIVYITELVAELINDGKLDLTNPIDRTVTYHDPCRLNKRKGIWESPRIILGAIPGITFRDVDRVTQWSYCSGAGGGFAIERPEIAEEISRRRMERAAELDVDTLVSACVWSERPLAERGRERDPVDRGARPDGTGRRVRRARLRGGEPMTVALDDRVIDELRGIVGDAHLLTGRSARYNRARVPSPFPVHRWSEHLPDVVVLPTSASQISEVVKLANRHRIPVVSRAGGTGLADGAVPLRGGILVDVKLMNRILDIDMEDRTVTVQPGINMLKLNERLRPYGVFYPDDPASYPCSIVGGRIGTSGWSLIGGRYGHTRDLVISFQICLPTGELIEVGDGGGRKLRKSSTGFQLKHLFMGHQGSLGIVTEATLELVPRPEAEFSAFLGYPDFDTAWRSTGAMARSGLATLAGVVLFDERKVQYLRRDDEAYIPQPEELRCVVATAMYGTSRRGAAGGEAPDEASGSTPGGTT